MAEEGVGRGQGFDVTCQGDGRRGLFFLRSQLGKSLGEVICSGRGILAMAGEVLCVKATTGERLGRGRVFETRSPRNGRRGIFF